MKINIIDAKISKSFRVFKLSSEDRTFVNKKFDVLHEQNKFEWTSKFTFYAFSVFVVWHMMYLPEKAPQRKNCVMMNIRGLNKIIEFDVYSMSLQSDIISCVQGCKYISIMNCASFFHQWRVAEKDRHKLIVITHREFEQWNVIVMKWKNFSTYVQKKMDELFKKYPYALWKIGIWWWCDQDPNEENFKQQSIFQMNRISFMNPKNLYWSEIS